MDLRGTEPGRVYIGSALVELHLPGIQSLKGKRAQMNRVKAALEKELACSVAEVGFQDLWQRAALGIAIAASSQSGVEQALDRVIKVIERDPRVIVTKMIEELSEISGP